MPGISWRSCHTPVTIDAAHTGVTEGKAAAQSRHIQSALHQRRERRRLAGRDGALEHRGGHRVDHAQDELGPLPLPAAGIPRPPSSGTSAREDRSFGRHATSDGGFAGRRTSRLRASASAATTTRMSATATYPSGCKSATRAASKSEDRVEVERRPLRVPRGRAGAYGYARPADAPTPCASRGAEAPADEPGQAESPCAASVPANSSAPPDTRCPRCREGPPAGASVSRALGRVDVGQGPAASAGEHQPEGDRDASSHQSEYKKL